MKRTIKVFVSYADADKNLFDRLDRHLASLKGEELVSLSSKNDPLPGSERNETLLGYLYSADLILLLVSSDFLGSETCAQDVKRAMRRLQIEEAQVLPILLRPAEWQMTPFARLQALPSDGRPVTVWRNQDQAFLDIVQGISAVLKNIEPLPPLDPSLLDLLNNQKEECRRKNVAFHTPHLLIALLDSPSIEWVLNDFESRYVHTRPVYGSGLVYELRKKLQGYIETTLAERSRSYIDFQWEERKDVQKSRRIAREDGADLVTAKYLLLGILFVESNTQKQLKNFLGESSFYQLRDHLESDSRDEGTPMADTDYWL